MLTVEELLMPRYKLKTRIPGFIYEPGHVVMFDKFFIHSMPYKGSHYPDLWEPLPWYADREASQMPEYVKWEKSADGETRKVIEWEISKHYGLYCITEGSGSYRHYPGESCLLPATATEYEQYKSKQV